MSFLLPAAASTAAAAGTAAAASTAAAAAGTAAAVTTAGSLAAFLPSLSTALTVLGTGLTTLNAAKQAKNQAAALKSQAAFAKMEARTIREQAEFDEGQLRRRASLLLGKQQAIGAASGVDITSGSSLFAELDNIKQVELEALNVRRRGQMAASSALFAGGVASTQARRARGNLPGIYLGGAVKAGGSVLGQLLDR